MGRKGCNSTEALDYNVEKIPEPVDEDSGMHVHAIAEVEESPADGRKIEAPG